MIRILIRLGIFLLLGTLTALSITALMLAIMPEQPPAVSADLSAPDSITLPAERQSVANGIYRLEITGESGWRSPTPMANFYKGDTLLWTKALPHQYGPRFALVSSAGQIVLFDEYINVASPYAIALISPIGETIATHSFDDIQHFLQDVSRADLVRQATSGWWISSPPQIENTLGEVEQNALVKTGGTTLQISLTTGELSRRDDL